MEDLKGAINGLYTNQHVLNEKIDTLLTICAKNSEDTNEVKHIVGQQLNALILKLNHLTNKLSDMEIQNQNANGEHDSIISSVQDVVLHVDDLKRTMDRWKIYSDIY